MAANVQALARALILLGGALAACGLALLLAPKIPWIGRLPGDLLIKREHVMVYVPLASCLLVSVVVSVVFWVIGRLR